MPGLRRDEARLERRWRLECGGWGVWVDVEGDAASSSSILMTVSEGPPPPVLAMVVDGGSNCGYRSACRVVVDVGWGSNRPIC